jgi:hypothetical protein
MKWPTIPSKSRTSNEKQQPCSKKPWNKVEEATVNYTVQIFWCKLNSSSDDNFRRKNLASCNKSANKPSTRCIRTAWQSCQQVWNNLLTTCTNLVEIIRLIARLFWQVRYMLDITRLLQPCVDNLVTSLLYIVAVTNLLAQSCNKADDTINLLRVVNSLFQTCYNKLGTSNANTTCWQLVNRLVTACLQICNNLFADLWQLVRFYVWTLLQCCQYIHTASSSTSCKSKP